MQTDIKQIPFTPGPWRVADSQNIAAGNLFVCSFHDSSAYRSAFENAANARLIAKAPELYALLQDAERIMGKHVYPKPDVGPGHPYAVLKRMRELLADIEGA